MDISNELKALINEFRDAALQVDVDMAHETWQRIRSHVTSERPQDVDYVDGVGNALNKTPQSVFWSKVGSVVGFLEARLQQGCCARSC